MKKLLCTLLAVAMLVSVMAIAAMADTAAAGDEAPVGFQYPTYTSPAEFPTASNGPGLVAAVLMKPDADLTDANGEGSGLYSRLRFIFTGENNMKGYNCHWGVGSIMPETSENAGAAIFKMGDGAHYLGNKYNYGTPEFRWDTDADGYSYFELIIVLHPNENGKWVDEEGTEYNTMYDMAKAGKLLATYGEHEDPNGYGYANGMINNDAGSFTGNMFGNYLNPYNSTLDSITVRMLTEEDYYEGGDRNNKSKTEFATLSHIVAHAPDGTVKNEDGTDVCKVSYVFKGWKGSGYEIAWGIALLPKTEDDKFDVRPVYADQYDWVNCDNDQNVVINGEVVNTTWSMFSWFEDKNGDQVFQVIFNMPQEKLQAAGYDNLEEAAFMGGLVGSVREHRAGTESGIIDCGNDGQGSFKANSVQSNGLDACVVGAISGCEYYGEEYVTNETLAPDTTEPVVDDTTAPADDETTGGEAAGTDGESEGEGTTEAPAEEGCASTIGIAALILAAMVAAPVAFARKKD